MNVSTKQSSIAMLALLLFSGCSTGTVATGTGPNNTPAVILTNLQAFPNSSGVVLRRESSTICLRN